LSSGDIQSVSKYTLYMLTLSSSVMLRADCRVTLILRWSFVPSWIVSFLSSVTRTWGSENSRSWWACYYLWFWFRIWSLL